MFEKKKYFIVEMNSFKGLNPSQAPFKGRYVVGYAKNRITKVKHWKRLPSYTSVPPKYSTRQNEEEEEEEAAKWDCLQCGKPTKENMLLLCDAPKETSDSGTCDRMICLSCSGFDSIPEGLFYCNKCKKK